MSEWSWYCFLSQKWKQSFLNRNSVVCGEANGTPLQYSCLENPRDRGAWWVAVYGVAQSQTRLKRLSSKLIMIILEGFPGGASGKEFACQCRRHGFNPWVGKIAWSMKWQPTPVFLRGESQGQRSLVGCCLWDCTESDTTEAT